MLNRVKIRKLNFNILLPDITYFNFSSTYKNFFLIFLYFFTDWMVEKKTPNTTTATPTAQLPQLQQLYHQILLRNSSIKLPTQPILLQENNNNHNN